MEYQDFAVKVGAKLPPPCHLGRPEADPPAPGEQAASGGWLPAPNFGVFATIDTFPKYDYFA